MFLNKFPGEIILEICKHLDSVSKIHLAMACPRTNEIMTNYSLFKEVDLSNLLYSSEEDIEFIIADERKCRQIQILNLDNWYWLNFEYLCKILKNAPNLRELYVMETQIGFYDIVHLICDLITGLKIVSCTLKASVNASILTCNSQSDCFKNLTRFYVNFVDNKSLSIYYIMYDEYNLGRKLVILQSFKICDITNSYINFCSSEITSKYNLYCNKIKNIYRPKQSINQLFINSCSDIEEHYVRLNECAKSFRIDTNEDKTLEALTEIYQNIEYLYYEGNSILIYQHFSDEFIWNGLKSLTLSSTIPVPCDMLKTIAKCCPVLEQIYLMIVFSNIDWHTTLKETMPYFSQLRCFVLNTSLTPHIYISLFESLKYCPLLRIISLKNTEFRNMQSVTAFIENILDLMDELKYLNILILNDRDIMHTELLKSWENLFKKTKAHFLLSTCD